MAARYPQLLAIEFLAVALSTWFIRGGESAAGIGLKDSVWKPICGLSEELGEIAADAAQRREEALSHAHQMRLGALRAAVFAAKNSGSELETKALVMLDYYERRATSALSLYRTVLAPKLYKATEHANYLKGRVDEYMKLLETSASADNNACLLNQDASGAAARSEKTKLDGTLCALETKESGPRRCTAVSIVNGQLANLIHGTGSGDNHRAASGTAHKCKLLTGHFTEGYATTQALTAAPQMLAGYLKINVGATPLVDLAAKEDLKSGAGAAAVAWKNALASIEQLDKAESEAVQNESGNLAERATLNAVVRDLLLAKKGQQQNLVGEKIIEVMGGKEAKYLQSYEERINNEKIPAGAAATEATTTLGEIASADELSALRSYYLMQASAKLRTTQVVPDARSGAAAADKAGRCSDLKDKITCDGKGCKWEGTDEKGQCKAKGGEGEVQAENDAKTTNTTGSHSFLINRAPLLLAFLLF